MAAKLVFALIAVVIIVAVAMALAFWHFNQESERSHEKDMKQMEQTDDLIEMAENNDDL